MTVIRNIQHYLKKSNIDIAFLIVILGIFMSPFIEYSWIVSIVACFFIKEDDE